jgi:sulfite reductase (NADPH) flavoprotein alpha-component
MVGPGTGIAPFRAFLEERDATDASGQSWLFFGDQKKKHNFMYQGQLEGYVSSGRLTKLSLAFSRDQEAKIYVQDRIREAADELWAWFQAGAYFYICGDASRMAKDVETALLDVFAKHTPDAPAYLKQLKTEKRYLRDVY